jgi:pimeloyl-ACP methyl ester carboxylesterase
MQGAAIRRARTDTPEIGYEEHGRLDAPVVMLLHGFPDDARAWDGVVPRLVGAGYRVIVPYLRGFGPTRFLDPARSRTAQQAALGQDLIDLIDVLGLGLSRAREIAGALRA